MTTAFDFARKRLADFLEMGQITLEGGITLRGGDLDPIVVGDIKMLCEELLPWLRLREGN